MAFQNPAPGGERRQGTPAWRRVLGLVDPSTELDEQPLKAGLHDDEFRDEAHGVGAMILYRGLVSAT